MLRRTSHSTRAEVPGYTPSERHVGEIFDGIMSRAQGRVITTTFASNISRIKQIVDIAHAWGRRTAIIGRSMENYTTTARELGYLEYPEGAIVHDNTLDVYIARLRRKLEPEIVFATDAEGNQAHLLAAGHP